MVLSFECRRMKKNMLFVMYDVEIGLNEFSEKLRLWYIIQ